MRAAGLRSYPAPPVLPRIAYLDFAARWFGQVAFDLASSGLAPLPASELGPSVVQDDLGARDRFAAALAARYRVSEREVVPCLGASGAVFSVLATAARAPERVLVESPGYEPLVRVAEGLGLGVDRFERRMQDAFAIDVERVLAALSPSTRLVTLSNPHNPSGTRVDDAVLGELAAELERRGVLLFVDEAYLELAAPAHTARRLSSNVITCASSTKCWGVPWARAGWVLLPPELASDAAHVERHVAGNAPPAAWAWGERIVLRADALNERARRIQSGKRALVDAFLTEHADALAWSPPHPGSLFGWVRDRRGLCSLARIERGLAEHGVLVSPGEFFGEPGAFRLGWSASPAIVEQGLARLARVLELS